MPDPLAKYVTERKTIERVVLVGPMEESGAAFDALNAGGFRAMRSGPYTDRKMHLELDMSRF